MKLSQIEAYAITLALEAALAAALAPRLEAKRARAALAAAGGSMLTHPIVWYGAYALYTTLGRFTVPALEAFAIAVETVVYKGIAVPRWRAALLLSALANAASWLTGQALYALP